jgi:anti-sigma factor RsiW
MKQQHLDTDIIIDYLHHELAVDDDAHVMQHISACAECAALYDRQAQLTEALRGYARDTESDLPAGVVARIWYAVERESAGPSFIQQLRAFFRPVYALPVAAALIAAVYFGAMPHDNDSAHIDAAYYLEDHAALTSTVPFNEGTVVPTSLENDETGSDQHWVATTGASDIAAER